jgi:hypothetical protein
VPDTICICGHWNEEHDNLNSVHYCEGCWVGGNYPDEHVFVLDAVETVKRIGEQE